MFLINFRKDQFSQIKKHIIGKVYFDIIALAFGIISDELCPRIVLSTTLLRLFERKSQISKQFREIIELLRNLQKLIFTKIKLLWVAFARLH